MKRAKATKPGTCVVCKTAFNRGDRIVYREAIHDQCHRGGFAAIPQAPTIEFTRLNALSALEEAIQVAATVNGVTDDMEKLWERYEKLKAVALRPGSPNEERMSFRLALIDAIKLAFS
jgi:hypothetical protein